MGHPDLDVSRLIDHARQDRPGALDQLLSAYRNYPRLLARTGIDASLRGKANPSDLVRRYRAAAARRVGRERSPEDLLGSSSQALRRLLADPGASPSESVQRREMSVVLADALAELSSDHREVLVLRSIEELDWGEVARIMGRSPGAVCMLWARALKQLRPLIEDRL